MESLGSDPCDSAEVVGRRYDSFTIGLQLNGFIGINLVDAVDIHIEILLQELLVNLPGIDVLEQIRAKPRGIFEKQRERTARLLLAHPT